MVGGNITACLQRSEGVKNDIGERVNVWENIATLKGWLDLSTGDSTYTYNAKIQNSTHIFICDYAPIDRKPENKRLVVNGSQYDVLLIDDPQERHEHMEIYLKLVI